MGIIESATEIVEESERLSFLERVAELLTAYPHGRAIIIVSDADGADVTASALNAPMLETVMMMEAVDHIMGRAGYWGDSDD